jgi:hypothetical protein
LHILLLKNHTKTNCRKKKVTINTNTTITTANNEKHNFFTKSNKEFISLVSEKATIYDENPQLVFTAIIMHDVSKSKYL